MCKPYVVSHAYDFGQKSHKFDEKLSNLVQCVVIRYLLWGEITFELALLFSFTYISANILSLNKVVKMFSEIYTNKVIQAKAHNCKYLVTLL